MEEKIGQGMTYRQMFRVFKKTIRDPVLEKKISELKILGKKFVFWTLVAELVMVLEPYPVKWFFDGFNQKWTTSTMVGICILIFVVYLFGTRIHYKMDKPRNHFFWLTWATLWNYCQYRQQKLGTDWHIQHSTGEKESIVAKNVTKVENLADELLFNTAPVTLRIIFTAIGVWWLGLHFGAIALVTIIAFGISLVKTEKTMEPLRKQFREQMKKIERHASELVKNWRILKQLGIEEESYLENDKLLMDFCEKERPRFEVFRKNYNRKEDIVSLFRAMMYGAIFKFSDPNQWGSIILATAWMERVFSNLYRFYNLERHLNEGKEAGREICAMLDIIPSIRQPEGPKWHESGMQGKIELCNVSMKYPGADKPILKKINCSVRPFHCVAFVGRTGSGKTTLASLLIREYDPTEGKILIDGIDLKELDYDRYRKEIAIVSQKIDLFDGTIAENVRKAKPLATTEEVIDALKKSDAWEFVEKTAKDLETLIGEDGVQLSGGQRQRLAIARALIRNPKILILDEATSSLDAKSQAEVQKTMDNLMESRSATIFVIAHRLSTIRQADQIIVLDDGEIVETGSHQELVQSNGLFNQFLKTETEYLSEIKKLEEGTDKEPGY